MLKPGIDPEKLYRATFIRQYGLCCCNMALFSFRLFRKNLEHLREFFGQMVYPPPPPPGKKFPVRRCSDWFKNNKLLSQLTHAHYRDTVPLMALLTCFALSAFAPASRLLSLA